MSTPTLNPQEAAVADVITIDDIPIEVSEWDMAQLARIVELKKRQAVRDGECLVLPQVLKSYPEINVNGRRIGLHRVVASLKLGYVPSSDLPTCHSCDNRRCFEERHVRIDTTAENSRDAYRRGRHPANRTCGEERPNARLTAELVGEFRRLAAAGAQISDIARAYELGHSVVYGAIRGTTWRQVTDPPPVPASRTNRVGSRNAHKVARPELVAAAAELEQQGLSLGDIATRLQVARYTAFLLCRIAREEAA